MISYIKPLFEGRGPDAQFADALAQGVFKIQYCAPCEASTFPPRVLCPLCGLPTLEWIDVSGRGILYSFTIVRRKVEHGGDYNVALVDLEEGPRLMSRVDSLKIDELRIGMPLAALITDTSNGKLLVFVPVEGGE